MVNIVYNHFKIKWPYTAFVLLNFSCELRSSLVFLLHYIVHPVNTALYSATANERRRNWCLSKWTMDAHSSSLTAIFQTKQDVLWPPKRMFWLKTSNFIWYDLFSSINSNEICTDVCWLLKGVESCNSRIVLLHL